MKNKKLKFSKDEVFFSSDLHIGHNNIIKYCPARWQFLSEFERNILENGSSNEAKIMRVDQESVDRMNEAIIDNINAVVDKSNALCMLGDVGWFKHRSQVVEFFDRINCKRIYLVVGNHDNLQLFPHNTFAGIYDQKVINVDGTFVQLNHYAMLRWDQSHRGSYHLFGHSHGTLNSFIAETLPTYRMLDVGVDSHNFKPWSFAEIEAYMNTKEGEKF